MIKLSANRNLELKLFLSTIIPLFFSCSPVNRKLDFPKSVDQVIEVEFFRPDEQPIREDWSRSLSRKETIELLVALKEAKYIGPTKFKPDFVIFIITKTEGTFKLKVNGNKIKGYDNDFTYEIKDLSSTKTFQREQ
ncbi:hypothetical protein [Nibribacter koreensis]|uniref:Lipoprotein n=1 Tax=Nibribacter koreensis TaxID=1084519 RepID=A0ABP8FJ72_9BACT